MKKRQFTKLTAFLAAIALLGGAGTVPLAESVPVVLIASAAESTDSIPTVTKLGDINDDGEVNVLDVIIMNKHLLGSGSLSAQGKVNADINKDGTATAADSLYMMKYVVKLIENLEELPEPDKDSYTIESQDGFRYFKYADHIEIRYCDFEAEEVIIPEEIDGLPVTALWGGAFFDPELLGGFGSNDVLKQVTIPKTLTKLNGSPFAACTALTSIVIPEDHPTLVFEDGILFNQDKTTLVQYLASNTDTSYTVPEGVTTIDEHAFNQCRRLLSVSIPEGVTSIGENAFYRCEYLTDIVLPDSLTELGGGAFYCCNALTDVTIPDGITTLRISTFWGCGNLTSVTLPPALTHIEGYALSRTALTEINFPESLVSINGLAFENCLELTSVYIPQNVTTLSEKAFAGCPALAEITVAEENTAYCSDNGVLYDEAKTRLMHYPSQKTDPSYVIPEGVTYITNLEYNPYLTNISIPDTVTEIDDRAFEHCSALTSVRLPAGITELQSYTFYYCTSLTEVFIPGNVTCLEKAVFQMCDAIQTVYYAGSEEEWNAIEFGACNDTLTTADIHFNSTPES